MWPVFRPQKALIVVAKTTPKDKQVFRREANLKTTTATAPDAAPAGHRQGREGIIVATAMGRVANNIAQCPRGAPRQKKWISTPELNRHLQVAKWPPREATCLKGNPLAINTSFPKLECSLNMPLTRTHQKQGDRRYGRLTGARAQSEAAAAAAKGAGPNTPPRVICPARPP